MFLLLKSAKTDTSKTTLFKNLGTVFCKTNPDTALYFVNAGIQLSQKINHKKNIADLYKSTGIIYENKKNYFKSIEFYQKALKLYEELKLQADIAFVYQNVAIIYSDQKNYLDAKSYYEKSLKIYEKLGDRKKTADCFNNIGVVYFTLGNYTKAIEFYIKSSKINDEIGDRKGKAKCEMNIGIIYKKLGNYSKALEYNFSALKTVKEYGEKKEFCRIYNNLGNIYAAQENYEKALENYTLSLEIMKEFDFKQGMPTCYNNIGICIKHQAIELQNKGENEKLINAKFEKSIETYNLSLKIADELGDKWSISMVLGNIAELYNNLKNYKEALKTAQQGLDISVEINAIENKGFNYYHLSAAYKGLGDFQNALKYYELFKVNDDSIVNTEKNEQITNMEAVYQNEKNQLKIEKLNKEKELQLLENKKQKLIIISVIIGLLFLIIFVIFIINRFLVTRSQKRIIQQQKNIVDEKNIALNQQKEEIETQHELVTRQKKYIENIYTEISDSINYAHGIQQAVLPTQNFIDSILADYFILYKPKDLVSGDFYWVEQEDKKIFISVVDCTGHGIPGAFMSMIGSILLNEIFNEKKIRQPSKILEMLNYLVQITLKREETLKYDGMDIAFCIIDKDTNQLHYSGAHNNAYIIRNQELIELKADRIAIGGFTDIQYHFTDQVFNLQKGDNIYLFSDGYLSQFGGEKGKRFLSKQFKKTLISISENPLDMQKEMLNNIIENWKNNFAEKFEQTDDITILGIKL